ncbi:hypothetical protein SCLCIDRAFT_1217321 [Scleroderma citrinum Foug A]|uniref:HTH cro/C1-type domain-containing protein n=1 Tax=Scleroderma citrinum Foug A TaxID=1036808 RepID=A0A0C3DUM2_9AGAM|nr:hypothetical protein SCLCIDRAFT_1217321 [Scleroderma citrinum Foug A]
MAPCNAITAAMNNRGLTYDQLAQRVGSNAARVQQICTGQAHPTTQEFNSIARELNLNPSEAPRGHAS